MWLQPPRMPENFDPRQFEGVFNRSNSDRPVGLQRVTVAVPDHIQTQEKWGLENTGAFKSEVWSHRLNELSRPRRILDKLPSDGL